MKGISLSTRRGATAAVVALVAVAAAAIGVTGAASHNAAKPKIAYLSFAVANSYDAPMLAAAKKVARAQGAGSIAVFDAANDPTKQLQQLQTLVTTKQYNGIILQPIAGPQLLDTVKQAFQAGIKVVNIDQILGKNPGTARPPLAGLSGNVVFVQTQIGRKQGGLVVAACKKIKANPCKVGYMYSVKVSSLDQAIKKGFDATTKGHHIQVVAEGQTFYNPAQALKDAQTMLQGHPDINLIVGADQAATGAEQALNGKKVTLVGYGGGAIGLNKVKAGKWYGTVMQRPATEGKLGMQCLIRAVKTGKASKACKKGIDVLAKLPNGGVVTKANAHKFHAEWPG